MMSRDQMLQLLSEQRREYAESWTNTANHSDEHGNYDWMADFLDGYIKILEIGVGNGLSTRELIERGHVVVGIDNNIECLERADVNLREIAECRLLRRESWVSTTNGLEAQYSVISETLPETGVLLIEGDITNDQALIDWLTENAPFDGVACWLIGTNSVDLVRHGGNPQHYRCEVQNRAYELSDIVLRSSGVLHIVDRGEAPTDESRERVVNATLESHRDRATVTDLIVDESSIDFREWTDPENGIQMHRSSQGSTEAGLALVSTIARNP